MTGHIYLIHILQQFLQIHIKTGISKRDGREFALKHFLLKFYVLFVMWHVYLLADRQIF